mgnify:CR=1 FL=1
MNVYKIDYIYVIGDDYMERTVVISVRIPRRVKEEIEALGVSIPQFVREAVERELRRRRALEALNWIRENRVEGEEIGFDSLTVIRKMREGR